MNAPIAIIGAGLAGLTAARTLDERGVEFEIYEASNTLGGLASSHVDADGFTDDIGAHFITNRLAAAVGASDQCYKIDRYGEAVWIGGRSIAYPFGLMAEPRYAASAMATLAKQTLSPSPITNASQWFTARYGATLAREIAIPLVEGWSGLDAKQLAPAVGEQMPGSIVRSLINRIAGILADRPVASGYCGALPESPHVYHVYPHGGVATLAKTMSADIAWAINYESPVQKIYVENERVTGIRVNGEDIEASAVISTASISVLAKLVEGSDALEKFRRFRYRPMVFVNLRLRGRGLLPNVVVWTPQSGSPIFRLTEAPLAMPTLAPEGKTTITVDIGAQLGDAYWTMDDVQLTNIGLDHLKSIIPDVESRFLGVKIAKTPISYPVFDNEYETDRQSIQHGLPIAGLHTIGRNGEFRHILMEDVYWRTRRQIRAMIEPYLDYEEIHLKKERASVAV